MRNTKLKELIINAQFAIIIAVIAQFTFPLGIIPITGQTLAIGLVATILGPRNSVVAIGLYLLLGLIGLPVFAGGQAGIGTLFGPTGGYLIGFIFYALVTGLLVRKSDYRPLPTILANWLGSAIALAFGTLWLKYSLDLSFAKAFATGVMPFLLPEVIKTTSAALLGLALRRALIRARLQLD